MASSSSSQILLLLVLYTILFASPITSYPLRIICKKPTSADFCLKLLVPHRNSSLRELGQIVINEAISRFTKTTTKIDSLLSETTDSSIRMIYNSCFVRYTDAARTLNAANNKLKSGKYWDVENDAHGVSRDVNWCKRMSRIASQPLPIASDNDYLYLITDVFISVSRTLSGSG